MMPAGAWNSTFHLNACVVHPMRQPCEILPRGSSSDHSDTHRGRTHIPSRTETHELYSCQSPLYLPVDLDCGSRSALSSIPMPHCGCKLVPRFWSGSLKILHHTSVQSPGWVEMLTDNSNISLLFLRKNTFMNWGTVLDSRTISLTFQNLSKQKNRETRLGWDSTYCFDTYGPHDPQCFGAMAKPEIRGSK